jgi:SAM-dependent methyltransferase
VGSHKDGTLIRDTLKKIPGVRSAYYLSMVLNQMVKDRWRQPAVFDEIFSATEDPWRAASADEQRRFDVVLSVIAGSGRTRFESAAELGCAEGIFTQRLAELCDEVTALDFSDVALSRARRRLSESRVRFHKWDMRSDAIPGVFDLVVAMGVLGYLNRPSDLRKVSTGVIRAIRPGGFLLFGDTRQSRIFEDAWWGRFLLRGGEQIRRHFARHPELDLIASADDAMHVCALFRRKA